jgi:hypothetical protein
MYTLKMQLGVRRLQRRSAFSVSAGAAFTHSPLTQEVTSFQRGYTFVCVGNFSDV